MSLSVVGHYTESSCVAGNFFPDEPVTRLVAKREGDDSSLPVYLPVIAPYLPAARSVTAKPKIYRSEAEIAQMSREREVCGGEPLSLPTLPQSKEGMVAFLQQAAEEGRIVWTSEGDTTPIYDLLQTVIDDAPGDLHLLFGYNHGVPAHMRFFNELIGLGQDGKKLQGITHLALEMFGADNNPKPEVAAELERPGGFLATLRRHSIFQGNMQPLIDHFLANPSSAGREFFRDYVETVATFIQQARGVHVESLQIAADPENNYQVIASDLSIDERAFLKKETSDLPLQFEARESFAVENAERYLKPGSKEVVAYAWGLRHTEKAGLPKHINCLSREGGVYSVAITGGARDDRSPFDLAVRDLARHDRRWLGPFALNLKGVREADLVIQLPYENFRLVRMGEENSESFIKLR